jgi:hypothetical protein
VFPCTGDFLAELGKGSQRVAVKAEILMDNTVRTDTDIVLTGGSVQVDSTAAVRRRCSCSIVDPDLTMVPVDATDVLSPYGYEIRLWRGLEYVSGEVELIPLGTFRISSVKVSDEGAVSIDLSGFDRSRSVSRARFESPYAIAAGTNYVSAIQALVSSRLPGVLFSSLTTAAVTPVLLFDQASDPWQAATSMAGAIGAEIFFDPMGICVIRTEPNPSGAPLTFIYEEGTNATILSVENNLTDEPGYNGVVVDGEPASGTPVHSVVYDADATSPTYYLGRYGKVPTFVKSQYITTQGQADEAAAAALRRERGGTEQLGFSAIPNPAHEGGDLVSVIRKAIGIDSRNMIQSFSIPLNASGVMNVTTVKQRML